MCLAFQLFQGLNDAIMDLMVLESVPVKALAVEDVALVVHHGGLRGQPCH